MLYQEKKYGLPSNETEDIMEFAAKRKNPILKSIEFSILSPAAIKKEEWETLYLKSDSKNIYCHPSYIQAITEILPSNFHPDYMIALHNGEGFVLLQPVKIRLTWLGLSLEFLKPFMGEHVEPLCTPEHKTEYFHAMMDFIIQEIRPNLIFGRALNAGFTAFLTEKRADLKAKVTNTYRVPYLQLPGTLDGLLNQYKPKFKRELLRRVRVAEKDGIEVRIVEADHHPDNYTMEDALENLSKLHQLRWGKNGHGRYDFSKKTIQEFHNQVIKHTGGSDILYPSFLELLHHGKVIGSLYALVTPTTCVFYYHSFDPAYRSSGLGNLLLIHILKYAIDKNLQLFDFKRGEDAYKYTWSSEWDPNYDVSIPMDWRGKVMLKNKKLREQLKFQEKLEAGLRKMYKRIFPSMILQ